MKRRNLQRMADHIRTVPEAMFDMSIFRKDNTPTAECNTVGCIIGHCIILGKPIYLIPDNPKSPIHYGKWAEQFTGLANGSREFQWCFDSAWFGRDNTPKGAALRIEWLLKNGLPKTWNWQMLGREPLCYLPASK